MKIKLRFFCLLMSLLFSLFFSQGGYNNMTNHQRGNFGIEPSFVFGKNNLGGSLMFGYYIDDFWQIRGGATFRNFEYKSYTEKILEGNIDAVYTVYSPRYDDPFLHKFNLALLGGFALENVKVTSKTQLINPYPKYVYLNMGTQLEFNLSDHLGALATFRQYYALNGSKEKLGNWRYDFSFGLRYYLWDIR